MTSDTIHHDNVTTSSIVANVANISSHDAEIAAHSSITGTRRVAIASLRLTNGAMFSHQVSRTPRISSPVKTNTKQNPTGLEAESLESPVWRTATVTTQRRGTNEHRFTETLIST